MFKIRCNDGSPRGRIECVKFLRLYLDQRLEFFRINPPLIKRIGEVNQDSVLETSLFLHRMERNIYKIANNQAGPLTCCTSWREFENFKRILLVYSSILVRITPFNTSNASLFWTRFDPPRSEKNDEKRCLRPGDPLFLIDVVNA